ncbi:MAG TPA: hypothetical protein VJT15_17320 [Pyrinomonadaceae bacterium]|nr:hypothetical protein [Pyrinomonadaceae bacterium]
MPNGQHLLVPIKVQALVVDDLVIKRRGALVREGDRYVANSGRWAPLAQDYLSLTTMLATPAPKPFFGASRRFDGKSADQLIVPQALWPKDEHRGVYLHWVLPSGLRHAHKVGSLDFPALPDQWLIVRFSRRGGEPQKTKAWFLDSSLVGDPAAPSSLLFRGDSKFEARKVGKVVALEDFSAAKFQGDHPNITAVGNAHTGSPTFTAFIAENKNVLSWHDTLNDLRNSGAVPKETTISYLLVGWYHNDQAEPLSAIRAQLSDTRDITAKDVLDSLGWKTDSNPPADLLQRSCLFHGMTVQVNYWTSQYKGSMLGYPGAPPVEDVLSIPPLSFKVGVGNTAEDALVSLVSSGFSGAKDKPNLWKALEAVIYNQTDSLVASWNTAPRDHTVHQHWFSAVEAGKVWTIRQPADNQGVFPTDPAAAAAETKVKPTADQLIELAQLNKLQAEADALTREIVALQQDLYARWWKLVAKSYDPDANLDTETDDCQKLAARLSDLRNTRAGKLQTLTSLPEQLRKKLAKKLELRSDAAPRFWTPADPVIVVENSGVTTKHRFPNTLPCRLPEQIATKAEVIVDEKSAPFNSAAGIQDIAAALPHFAPRADILNRLVNEASLVEQATSHLVEKTLPASKQFNTALAWQEWLQRITRSMEWDGNRKTTPGDQVYFRTPDGTEIRPSRLAELWGRQPWSPLFLDWQITWFPTTPQLAPRKDQNGKDFGPTWPLADHDYEPLDRKSLEPFIRSTGITVRGRSLLSPIDERIFKDPIKTLRSLLDQDEQSNPAFPPKVVDILKDYNIIWDETLKKLGQSGLMGQSLSGFHQTLLNRDVTAPQIMPDAANPWIEEKDLRSLENEIRGLLEGATMGNERLAPPTDEALRPPPFSTLRTGVFKIDELWLVDDFGQWADLLGGTPAGNTSAGQVFHPRMRWHDDQEYVAMPPRVIQPARLNFRFTATDADSNDPLGPICGWIFYNPLDHALVVCEKSGRLAGELVITRDRNGWRVKWRAVTTGSSLADIRNQCLRDFAAALVQDDAAPAPNPRLLDLLTLIDRSLQRIRPAAARREAVLFGRPLALVSANLGLELFGKAWTDPHKDAPQTRPASTGDAMLDDLLVPANLGCSHNTEDGLIGYFVNGDYNRLIAAHLPKPIDDLRSGYIAQLKTDRISLGFREPARLTMLMDPWGSVQAACGLVPAKEITLGHAELDKAVTRLETSFRVGPVLLQPDRIALPAPAGDKGQWNFFAPMTGDSAAALAPFDTTYFGEQPVTAAEGRLVLLTPEE